MIKQIILPLAAVAAFIVIVGLLVNNSGNINIPGFPTPAPNSLSQKAITVGGKSIKVGIADTESARELGLGGRDYLSPDSGMLFIFDKKGIIPSFWMKDMLIPLDIIWIAGGKVVQIDKNIPAPAPGTPDSALTAYSPGQPIDYVLEVNAGFSDVNNLKTGTNVQI